MTVAKWVNISIDYAAIVLLLQSLTGGLHGMSDLIFFACIGLVTGSVVAATIIALDFALDRKRTK